MVDMNFLTDERVLLDYIRQNRTLVDDTITDDADLDFTSGTDRGMWTDDGIINCGIGMDIDWRENHCRLVIRNPDRVILTILQQETIGIQDIGRCAQCPTKFPHAQLASSSHVQA